MSTIDTKETSFKETLNAEEPSGESKHPGIDSRITEITLVPDENDLVDTHGAGHFTSDYNKLRDFRKREVHWNYYDAMHKSKPTAAAREAGTNSLEEGNLDKYFKQTLSRSKFNNLDTFMAASTSATRR